MPVTYDKIATQTVTTATSTITFNSITSAYTDLIVVTHGTATSNGLSVRLQFNGDTTTNYSRTTLSGYSSAAGSTRFTNASSIGSNWQVGGGTDGPSPVIFQILNYTNTTTFKTVLLRGNFYPYGGNSEVTAEVGLWRKTPEAINSITVTSSPGNFAVGSTFTIYGIKAA